MRDDGPRVFFEFDSLSSQPWLTALLERAPAGVALCDGGGEPLPGDHHFVEAGARVGTRQGQLSVAKNAHAVADGVFPAMPLVGSPDEASRQAPASVERLELYAGSNPVQSGDKISDWGRHLTTFADSSSNAITIVDVDSGNIDYLNRAARGMWAESEAQLAMSDWQASVHPDDRMAAIAHRRRAQSGENQRFEYRIIARSGDVVRHVRESCFLIPSSDNGGSAIGAIVEDTSPTLQLYLIQQAGTVDVRLAEELHRVGRRVHSFASTADFLNVAEMLQPGCVIVDLRKADLPATQVLDILRFRPAELQVILIGPQDTAAADVIAALKAGAADYLLEPQADDCLLKAVQKACRPLWEWVVRPDGRESALNERLRLLPKREREVLLALVAGGTNKTIARSLKLSPRTVEVHRSHLMQRLNVRTLTELLHLARDAGLKV